MGGSTDPRPVGTGANRMRARPGGGDALPGPVGMDDVVPLDAPSANLPPVKAPPATTSGRTTVNGAEVTVEADGRTDAGKGAETSFDIDMGHIPGYDWENKKGKKVVSKINGPIPVPALRVQTVYFGTAQPTDISGYGRGTTDADRKAGNVTLGFHESMHRQDCVDFVTANAVPAFGGKVDMTIDEWTAAVAKYRAAVTAYRDKLRTYSAAATDEVGSPPKSRYQP